MHHFILVGSCFFRPIIVSFGFYCHRASAHMRKRMRGMGSARTGSNGVVFRGRFRHLRRFASQLCLIPTPIWPCHLLRAGFAPCDSCASASSLWSAPSAGCTTSSTGPAEPARPPAPSRPAQPPLLAAADDLHRFSGALVSTRTQATVATLSAANTIWMNCSRARGGGRPGHLYWQEPASCRTSAAAR